MFPQLTILFIAPVTAVFILAMSAAATGNSARSLAATPEVTPAASTQVPATERMPPTMGPPTPTPALPEEGGPAGGVLSGHLYIDTDGNGTRSDGDDPVGDTVVVQLIGASNMIFETTAKTNEDGRWEVRAVPDGTFRVMWNPPLRDPSNLRRTLPAAETIEINPLLIVTRVQRIVEIRDANRILDIDMGMPDEGPVFGGGVQLPPTGTGGGGVGAPALLLAFAAAGSLALAAAIALGRRSRA